MTDEQLFLNNVLSYIKTNDALHFKKVRTNVDRLSTDYSSQFYTFLSLLFQFFNKRNIDADKVAEQYLKMVNDMRIEGITFKREKKYSCANQHEAFIKVYSRPDIMEYYMNALLLSQVLWIHHFRMLMFFNEQLANPVFSEVKTVLDIGPGHGFFSFLVQKNIGGARDIDIVDISDSSLAMTKAIIGDGGGKIQYYNRDIFNYESQKKYDLIILGEVLEHLDKPLDILIKLGTLLSEKGTLWLTTPTNAPALDHVYLFRSKQEITDLLNQAHYRVQTEYGCYAEDVKPELAEKFDISYLYGAFLKNN